MNDSPPAEPAPAISRRRALRLLGIGAVALGATAVVSAGDTARRPRRPEAAAGSEERVVYSSHDSPAIAAALRRYLQAYPSERVELVQLSPADALERVARERQAPNADVWIHPYVNEVVDLAERDDG